MRKIARMRPTASRLRGFYRQVLKNCKQLGYLQAITQRPSCLIKSIPRATQSLRQKLGDIRNHLSVRQRIQPHLSTLQDLCRLQLWITTKKSFLKTSQVRSRITCSTHQFKSSSRQPSRGLM